MQRKSKNSYTGHMGRKLVVITQLGLLLRCPPRCTLVSRDRLCNSARQTATARQVSCQTNAQFIQAGFFGMHSKDIANISLLP